MSRIYRQGDLFQDYQTHTEKRTAAESAANSRPGGELSSAGFSPRSLLRLQSRNGLTEIQLYFLYREGEVRWNEHFRLPGKALEADKERSEPAGRDRAWEDERANRLIGILQDHTTFIRGAYSLAVTSNDEAGDIRLELSLNDFLSTYGQTLLDGEFEILLSNKPVRLGGKLRFSIRSEIDWFGIRASVAERKAKQNEEDAGGGQETLELDDAFNEYGMVDAGGMYVQLDESDIRQIRYLQKLGMSDNGILEISPVNFSLIDVIYDNIVNKDEEPVRESRRMFRTLSERGRQEATGEAPAGFPATLREYQKAGLGWLLFLHENGINGCLADDMGLGKTIQTLALLQELKNRSELGTSLVVAPVVTLSNWESEIENFTPTMRCLRHSGPSRPRESSVFSRYDLIVVSYHTLKNDIELFFDFHFDYIILDEAHYIKNASSQVFKAVRTLKSAHRLALSGTPIENSTLELWSLMNFLNPGLLGNFAYFRRTFALPIEKHRDENAARILRDMVHPFILRRRKDDVLSDLPEKDEIVHYAEMGTKQRKVYHEQRELYKETVLRVIDTKGIENAAVEIFKFILKLRQLAIFPPMAGPEFATVPSCKLDSIGMLLDEVLAENHKVLVFSQFLQSLSELERLMHEKKWEYSLLTGSTRDRKQEILRFQQHRDVRVFLLSLKAGGVGINLTAADYVILLDPWWNPSVEKQAVDRAHRMGQKRRVTYYKLITRDTIEEKILALQEKKNALISEIIGGKAGAYTGLTREEIEGLFS